MEIKVNSKNKIKYIRVVRNIDGKRVTINYKRQHINPIITYMPMKKILFALLLFISTTASAVKNIEIISMNRYDSYSEARVTMRFNMPASLKDSLGATMPNAASILAVYGYSIDSIWVSFSETVSFLPGTLNQFKNSLENEWTKINTKLNAITPKPYEKIIGAYWDNVSGDWTTP